MAGSIPFSRSRAKVRREVLQRGLWYIVTGIFFSSVAKKGSGREHVNRKAPAPYLPRNERDETRTARRDQDPRSDHGRARAVGDADPRRSGRRGDQDRIAGRRHHALCGTRPASRDGPCLSQSQPQQTLARARSETRGGGAGAPGAGPAERRSDAQYAPAGDGTARLRLGAPARGQPAPRLLLGTRLW